MTLTLEATAALKTRLYGVVAEAQGGWTELASPMSGKESFSASAKRILEEKEANGLVILVDNLPELDQATLHFLRDMLLSNDLPQFALIYTTDPYHSLKGLLSATPLQASIIMQPLSQEAIHIWLRDSLHWEASLDFVAWFHRETTGIPANIECGLGYLIEHGILQQSGESWVCRQDLDNIPLAVEIKKAATPPGHNLPRYVTDFIGRTEEIKAIKHLITEHRMITLRGPGGIGKTRLAIQVATESLRKFPQGVWLVSLAQINFAELLVSTIADALQFAISSPEDTQTQLLNYLRGKELLLVLDNFEESFCDTGFLQSILEQAPRVTLLVTSRERLGLSDEILFDIGGLSTPGGENENEVEQYSAVQLFVHSARRVFHGFSLSEEDKPFVTKICRLVGGTPLGVELAAAWTPTFSVKQISTEIESNLSFLTEPESMADRQHRGLQAVFDSFWKLLSESEHSVLRGLSVFQGGFNTEAANQVAGASLFFLDGLVAKSQLRRTVQGRYEIHELLRQFAGARLATLPGVEARIRNLHCDYFARFLQKHEDGLAIGEKGSMEEVAEEIENIRAAWAWSTTQVRWTTITHILPGFSDFFFHANRYYEGEDAIAPVVEKLDAIMKTADEGDINVQMETRREQRQALGWLYAEQARFQNALARYGLAFLTANRAIELSQSENLPYVGMVGHLEAGIALLRKGTYPQAIVQLERGLSLAQTSRALRMEGEIRRTLGIVLIQQCNYAAARNYLEQALNISRQLGNRRGESAALGNLGLLSLYLDDFNEARILFEQVLILNREINNRQGESLTINNLGVLHRDQGEYVRATKYFEQSLQFCREIGDRQGEGYAFGNLGIVFTHLGEYEKASQYLKSGLSLFREIRNRQAEANTLTNLCRIYVLQGDTATSFELGQQALTIEQEIGERYGLGYALQNLGLTIEKLGRWEDAIVYYEQAQMLRTGLGQKNLAIESQAGLARIFLAQGDRSKAQAQIEAILDYLATKTLDGTDDPFLVYLTCYKILISNEDPRALEILNTTHEMLLNRASRINDNNLRDSYLENVPAHKEIMREWNSIAA